MAGALVMSSLLYLLLLALPLIGGIVLIMMSKRKGKGYPACGRCGYDVSATLGTTSARCPECGGEFAVVGVLPPVTPTRRWPLTVGVLLVVFPITCVGGGIFLTRASYQRASQSAQAAAVRAAKSAQQAQWAATPADPARVSDFRSKLRGVSAAEASARLTAVTQELAQRQADETLDESIAASLRAELQALSEHLSSQPPGE